MCRVRNQKSSNKSIKWLRFSFLVIVRDIKKSRKVISNLLQDPEAYETKKSTLHSLKLSTTVCWRVLQEASRKGISSRNFQTSLDLNVTPSRVWQILNSSKDFIYKKRIPTLTKMHKKKDERSGCRRRYNGMLRIYQKSSFQMKKS